MSFPYYSYSTLDPYVKDISTMNYFQPLAIKLAWQIPKDFHFILKTHLPHGFSEASILKKIAIVVGVPLLYLTVTFTKVCSVLNLEVVFLADHVLSFLSHIKNKLAKTALAVYLFAVSFISKKSQVPALNQVPAPALQDGRCIICFDDMAQEESVKRPGCPQVCQTAQRVHENCLREWLKTKNQCPSCQAADPLKDSAAYLGDFPWDDLGDMRQESFLRTLREKKIPFKVEEVRFLKCKKYTLTFIDEAEPVIIYFGRKTDDFLIFPTPQHVQRNFVHRMNRRIPVPMIPAPAPIPPLQVHHMAAPIQYNSFGSAEVAVWAAVACIVTASALNIINGKQVLISTALSMFGYSLLKLKDYQNQVGRAVRV